MKLPEDDALFQAIRHAHGERPWGSVLDAGTGRHSLEWICGLPTQRWTAVTGARSREDHLCKLLGERVRPVDQFVTGNWTDPTLLHGERFDVVLADYLLGAIDGFAPYFQSQLFARLRPLVGGRLYAVGMEPFPDQADSPGRRAILDIARLRDACILLAGHRCYREYPLEWVLRSLDQSRYRVIDAQSVPIVYRERFINGQLDVCVRKLPYVGDTALRQHLARHIDALREHALGLAETAAGIHFGSDWVVAAEPV